MTPNHDLIALAVDRICPQSADPTDAVVVESVLAAALAEQGLGLADLDAYDLALAERCVVEAIADLVSYGRRAA
ncbi:MAG: hypothetical protein GY898_17935 [Proteobacteria bacterium]|nr:hypothetical protein [Actinomycetes bacterium]MCP4870587.1 hypothetical protein [Pseudomonadota bacterium]